MDEEKLRALAGTCERRYASVEFRLGEAIGDTGRRKIEGHASVFNVEADLGYFVEKVSPGAFTASIGVDDVRALFNHDDNIVLGRSKPPAGKTPTLRLSEDHVGLFFSCDPPDTQWGKDLQLSIDRGDISQCSIGFNVKKFEITRRDDGSILRDIKEMKLWDVSPVTFPAFVQTDVALRSAKGAFDELRRGPELPPEVRELLAGESWKHGLDDLERRLQLVRM